MSVYYILVVLRIYITHHRTLAGYRDNYIPMIIENGIFVEECLGPRQDEPGRTLQCGYEGILILAKWGFLKARLQEIQQPLRILLSGEVLRPIILVKVCKFEGILKGFLAG